jgi:hypothetical protein
MLRRAKECQKQMSFIKLEYFPKEAYEIQVGVKDFSTDILNSCNILKEQDQLKDP